MSHFTCAKCGGMKYAANITRKPGGLNMASACFNCDGAKAIADIQKQELASLKIHDDAMKKRSQKQRAKKNVKAAQKNPPKNK
jgi:hypothetical protein